MSVRYIIQARMSSTRLSGKVLMEIGQKPLIQHIIDRLLLSGANKSQIYFALAVENSNELYKYLDKQNIQWISGDTFNVLSRFIKTSQDLSEKDIIVRLTGDNPFIDFQILKDNLKYFDTETNLDFSFPFKLPLGMGFELFRKGAMIKQLEHDLLPHHLEHVTTFIKENKNLFNIKQIDYYKNSPDIRLTIDYPEDLKQARDTYNFFSKQNLPYFCSSDVFNLYNANSNFFNINKSSRQKSPKEYAKDLINHKKENNEQ
ncbi:MAG: hypothetical protein OEV78_02740 [Spirochaetia bacterium]|nr:hypothetical protein [Spirochaetia bacterium]